MGLINVEDRGTVCEKGAKPPNCGMSDFTTRSLTWCLGNSSGIFPGSLWLFVVSVHCVDNFAIGWV